MHALTITRTQYLHAYGEERRPRREDRGRDAEEESQREIESTSGTLQLYQKRLEQLLL